MAAMNMNREQFEQLIRGEKPVLVDFWATRRAVCEDMEYMGMKIDVEKNEGMRGEEMVISTPDSKVTIIVVPTDEEFMIAADTLEILDKK